MSQEIDTTLRWDGRILEVKALLERGSLAFRGGVTMTVPFAEMLSVEASSGWLELRTPRGLLLLELGPKAEAWREKIKNPKGLIDKLGLGEGKKVCVVGKLDPDLRDEIGASGARVAKSARGKGFDVVFVAASTKKDLDRLPAVKEMISDDGAIWIVYAKGGRPDGELTERSVLTAGRTLQLTDDKRVEVTDALTAVRFVIPAAYRKKRR